MDPDALVDLFDYRRSACPEEAAATCTLRVRAEACGGLLAGNGSEGLFIKDFSNNGTVEWQKPLPGEMPRAFLYRVLRLSGQQRLAGLAFSATGSLGLRRVAGAMPSSCAANGFSCGTPRSALLSFLSDQQWRDVVLSSTTNRRAFLQLFFRGRPPLNSAVEPWEYAVDDGMCVTISPWQSISRPRLVEKLFTPPFRQATPVVVPPTAALAPCIADVEMTDPRTQGQRAVAPCLDGPPLKHRRCLPAAEVNLEALVLTKVTNSRAGHCLFVALLQSLESCRDPKCKKQLVPKTAKDVRSQVVSGLLTMERTLAGWFDHRVPAHPGRATWQEYCDDTRKQGSWGCMLELLVACKIWRLEVVLIQPGKEHVRVGGGPRRIWLHLHEDHYECLLPSSAQDCKAARQLLIDSVAEIYNEVMPTTPLDRELFTRRGGGGKGLGVVDAFCPLRVVGGPLPKALWSGPGVSSSRGALTEERLLALDLLLGAPRASRELHDLSSVGGASAGAAGLPRSFRIRRKTSSAVPAGDCSSEDAVVVGAGLPDSRKLCARRTVAVVVRPCDGVQVSGGAAAVDGAGAHMPAPHFPEQADSLLLTMPRRCGQTSLAQREARVALLCAAAADHAWIHSPVCVPRRGTAPGGRAWSSS